MVYLTLTQGGVLQFYLASCNFGSEADLARVQCQALPSDCTVPSPLNQFSLSELVLNAAQGREPEDILVASYTTNFEV